MLNIAICDDEDVFIKKIELIVSDYLSKRHIKFNIDSFESGLIFSNLKYDMNKYDIVFMDINMDEMDGIETSRILRSYCPDTYLIFITAFINYTIECYKVEAIRYILKDYDNMEGNIIEALDTILNKMAIENKKIRYDFVGVGEKDVCVNDIVYIDNNLHKVSLHLFIKGKNIIYEIYKKLSDIENDFKSDYLIRTHQSFIVNMQYVTGIKRYEAALSTGEIVPISKTRYKEVHEAYIKKKGVI